MFRILGPLECELGGRPIRIRGAKQHVVLSLLLLAGGRAVSLTTLIDAVWDESAPPTAAKQIRNAVSRLRAFLAPTGVTIPQAADGYRLDRAGSALDLEQFVRTVQEADRSEDARGAVQMLRSALRLWRGPALAGMASPALRNQISRIEEHRLSALEACVERELHLERRTTFIAELTAAVAEHPFRERLIALLMTALSRSGARAEALELFDQTRRLLRDELGVDPGRHLRHAYLDALGGNNHEQPGASTPREERVSWNNLPGHAARVVDRNREWELVRGALRLDGGTAAPPALIAVDGMTGVGKTVFALDVSRRLADSFPDGQLYVNLSAHGPGSQPLSGEDALAVLLNATGVPGSEMPAGLQSLRSAWLQALRGRRAIVILDDVADTSHVEPLLVDAPGCLTVVTSRRRLTGLHPAHQLTLSEMSIAAGRRLFRSMVGDQRAAAEAAAVDEVLHQCGRLPLAIHSAAVRLRHRSAWSVSYLASRLADDRSRLAELKTESTDVVAAFNKSFDRLGAEPQRIFRLAGRTGGEDIDAGRIAGLAGLPLSRTTIALEELADVHLLKVTGHGLYRMNELVRAYSAQLS